MMSSFTKEDVIHELENVKQPTLLKGQARKIQV